MIAFKTGSAVNVKDFMGKWQPQCHWILQSNEPIEAQFVQALLDKYGHQVEAYSILPPLGGTYCVQLQFFDDAIGEQCNQEYVRGWRKGGEVATQKKAARTKARKRLYMNRMYILPDGTEFLYFAKWDNHGNLVGKVLTDAGGGIDEDGQLALENKIVHRSLLEQSDLVPRGQERFVFRELVTPEECRRVYEAVCALRARFAPYGPGDCAYGEPLDNVMKTLRSLSVGKIRSALEHLATVDGFITYDHEAVWVTHAGWRGWSKWKDKFFLDIVFSESGQDWPDWEEERDYWKDIDPTIWQKLNAEADRAA